MIREPWVLSALPYIACVFIDVCLASNPKLRPLISRLVVDAHLASQRRLLAQAAAGAGIPYLVDPLTHLLQGESRVEDRWARLLCARARAVAAEELNSEGAHDELVAAVVDFQVESGATAVIPPYAYAAAPEDPWFTISLDLVTRTAEYMRRSGIKLQIPPLLCGPTSILWD